MSCAETYSGSAPLFHIEPKYYKPLYAFFRVPSIICVYTAHFGVNVRFAYDEGDILGYVTTKVSKVAKIRNRHNQVPHPTQDTNGKVTNPQKTPQTRAKRPAPPPPPPQQATTKHTQTDAHKTQQTQDRTKT